MRFLNASVLPRKAQNRDLSWGFPLGNLLPKTRVLKHRVLERKRRQNANASVLGTQRFRTLRARLISRFFSRRCPVHGLAFPLFGGALDWEKLNRGVSHFFGKGPDCVADPFGTVPRWCCLAANIGRERGKGQKSGKSSESPRANRENPEKNRKGPKIGNGRNTVSRVLFRRRELTEPH